MSAKPTIEVCCSTCSHERRTFGYTCGSKRDKDARNHGFCPCWKPRKDAIQCAMIQYAHANGLDPWKIVNPKIADWHVSKNADVDMPK